MTRVNSIVTCWPTTGSCAPCGRRNRPAPARRAVRALRPREEASCRCWPASWPCAWSPGRCCRWPRSARPPRPPTGRHPSPSTSTRGRHAGTEEHDRLSDTPVRDQRVRDPGEPDLPPVSLVQQAQAERWHAGSWLTRCPALKPGGRHRYDCLPSDGSEPRRGLSWTRLESAACCSARWPLLGAGASRLRGPATTRPHSSTTPAAFGAYASKNGVSISNALSCSAPPPGGPEVAGGRAGVFPLDHLAGRGQAGLGQRARAPRPPCRSSADRSACRPRRRPT